MVTRFCEIDDFCRSLLAGEHPQLPARSGQKKGRGGCLSWSEVMTSRVFFPASHDRTFQHFYQGQMLLPGRAEFPGRPRYKRFVELIPMAWLALCGYLPTRPGPATGLQCIDSLPLRVCHHRRLSSHKVLAGLAQRGQSSRGWCYGFPLPLVSKAQGEVLGLTLTPGHSDDRRPVAKLVPQRWGQWFGERGDLGQELLEQLWAQGLPLITKLKRHRRNKLMPLLDKLLLRKRALLECVHDQRKNSSQLQHPPHRSAINGIVNRLAAVVAYTFPPQKPALDRFVASQNQAQQLLLAALTV
jgi:Transposase DDE domain